MSLPVIEPQSLGPVTNTLTIMPMVIYVSSHDTAIVYIYLYSHLYIYL